MSTDVQAAGKADTKDADKQSRRRSKDTEKTNRRSTNFQNKKHSKQLRKRAHSFNSSNGKFFPPYKMRKKDLIIPPTKFLLGGNITDPLNLNSLQDEEINRAMNAVTPKSSPLPTPRHRRGEIEVIIPPDITDPLNLIAGDDDATYEAMLTSPIKRVQKKQKKNKKRKSNNRSSTGSVAAKEDAIEGAKVEQPEERAANEPTTSVTEETKKEEGEATARLSEKEAPLAPPPQKRHKTEGQNRASLRKMELKERKADLDKIVSPVIPQPGAWSDRHRFRPPPKLTPQINQAQATPNNFREGDAKFQYGNYNKYYGYRNPNLGSDVRLKVLERHKSLFRGKDVLDIGCNTGHLTLAVARDFGPNKVVGIDIDRALVEIARINIKHYVNCGKKDKFFPVSMPIVYGPIDVPGVQQDKAFPHNISFIQGNYVLESDVLLALEQPQFDVIICFSITKWMHLNWGDAGLKRAFKRMYAQLRPGGALLLEAQSWNSYKKKKKLTPEIWKNYHSVELFPHQFTQYLLSEVGFSKCEVIGAPLHQSKGFQRQIKLFIKEDTSFDTPIYSANTSTYGRDTPATHNFPGNSSSYSFRLPDSVHFADEFSGDSGFPYGTPSDFNSPESGFSEGLHQPRRYPPRIAAPMEEVSMEPDNSQQEERNSLFEEQPISAELLVEDTAISVASSSATSVESDVKTAVQGKPEQDTGQVKEESGESMQVECDSETISDIKTEDHAKNDEASEELNDQEVNVEPEKLQGRECLDKDNLKVELISELLVEDTTNSVASSNATSVDEEEDDIPKASAVGQDKNEEETKSVEQESGEYALEKVITNVKSEDNDHQSSDSEDDTGKRPVVVQDKPEEETKSVEQETGKDSSEKVVTNVKSEDDDHQSSDSEDGIIKVPVIVQDKPEVETKSVEQETEVCSSEKIVTDVKSEDNDHRVSSDSEVVQTQEVKIEPETSQSTCAVLTRSESGEETKSEH